MTETQRAITETLLNWLRTNAPQERDRIKQLEEDLRRAG